MRKNSSFKWNYSKNKGRCMDFNKFLSLFGVVVFSLIPMSLMDAKGSFVDNACKEWFEHEEYWGKRGNPMGMDPISIEQGFRFRSKCDLFDPCGQLERHNEYWAQREGQDDARKNILNHLCAANKKVEQVVGQAKYVVKEVSKDVKKDFEKIGEEISKGIKKFKDAGEEVQKGIARGYDKLIGYEEDQQNDVIKIEEASPAA